MVGVSGFQNLYLSLFVSKGVQGRWEFSLPSHMYVSHVTGGAYLVCKRDAYKGVRRA